MSFQTEFARIPKFAMTLAAVVYVCMVLLVWRLLVPQDESLKELPFELQLFITFVVPAFLAVYILLVGYIYADAKRRRMRHVMWTWLAALVPNAIGMILYFIMRDALPTPCPGCAKPVLSSYPFCPHCGFATAPRCPKCSSAVKHEWSNCPFCGTSLQGTTVVKP